MILSEQSIFSDAQAITATANSTNVVKLPKNLNKGQPVRLLCQVVEDFAGLTDLTVQVRADGAVASGELASAEVLVETAAIAAADLKAGYKFPVTFMPANGEDQYVDLNYVVGGSNATAGKITAAVVFDDQSAS